jgi:hypothetical protein
MAWMSLVLAILIAPVGLAFGIVSLRKYLRRPDLADDGTGRGLSIASVVVAGVLCLLSVISVIFIAIDSGGGGGVGDRPPIAEAALEDSILFDGEFELDGRTFTVLYADCAHVTGPSYTCLVELDTADYPAQHYDVTVGDDGSWVAE